MSDLKEESSEIQKILDLMNRFGNNSNESGKPYRISINFKICIDDEQIEKEYNSAKEYCHDLITNILPKFVQCKREIYWYMYIDFYRGNDLIFEIEEYGENFTEFKARSEEEYFMKFSSYLDHLYKEILSWEKEQAEIDEKEMITLHKLFLNDNYFIYGLHNDGYCYISDKQLFINGYTPEKWRDDIFSELEEGTKLSGKICRLWYEENQLMIESTGAKLELVIEFLKQYGYHPKIIVKSEL